MPYRFLLLLGVLFCTGILAAQERLTIPGLPGKPMITGYWFPAKESEAAAVIIGLHGCSGALNGKGQLTPKWKELAAWFNREGMHFLVPDSFSPRGQKSICEIPNSRRTIDEDDRREDVFAAINWLNTRREVDTSRIAVAGWSHGAQTVLKALDRTDRFVQSQLIQPRAGIAYYPGCKAANQMFSYELSAPLLLMIGELDDWTPAGTCVQLERRLQGNQGKAALEMIVFPESYHGFDDTSPVQTRKNIGNSRFGTVTVGGNPTAREKSRVRLFDFLAEKLDRPLHLSHETRFLTHAYTVPAASGFARIDDLTAVPVADKGKPRYAHYLTLPKPKAFVVTEKGGWFFSSDNVNAMQNAFDSCPEGTKCWLYAVDDQVVWNSDQFGRIARVSPID